MPGHRRIQLYLSFDTVYYKTKDYNRIIIILYILFNAARPMLNEKDNENDNANESEYGMKRTGKKGKIIYI